MLTLEKVKSYLAEKHNVKVTGDDPVIFTDSAEKSATTQLTDWMSQHINEVADVLNRLEERTGLCFHDYFAEEEKFEELCSMRYSDPELFYTIIRYEELFLNTCMRMMGSNAIIHFELADLFGD